MATATPAINEALVHARVPEAKHGQKGALVAQLCSATGKSRATVYRQLQDATVRAPRRKRSDAGDVALTRDEAKLISVMVMESMRKNNKRLYTIGHAVEALRANNAIKAERIDPKTGECKPLSVSAIARAMRVYGLHPDQMLKPAPARELRSLHPNHAWQIDASLCVLYYLETTNPQEMGLQVMEAKKFNKNKPKNMKRIEDRRVWSYEVTDHNSGAIFACYVFDGESAANIAESFIAAIQQRGEDPFYGVPLILMMDMGSANTSGMFKNLLQRLQVKAIAHAPENARATGQVENARNILERDFESGLRLKPVQSLADLNARVGRWLRWFNATKVHSRHGKTRAQQWMTIAPEQLRIAPSPELCRELLTHTPVSRKVSDFLRIEFKGAQYDVSGVPRVMVTAAASARFAPLNNTPALETPTMNELLKKLLATLGLPEDAGEEEAIKALGAMKAQLDAAHQELGLDAQADAPAVAAACARLRAAGAADPAQFVPVAAVRELQTQVAALSAQARTRQVDDLITPALQDGRLLPALETWARDLGASAPAALAAYLDKAQPVAALTGTQTRGRAPQGAGNNPHGLSDDEMAVAVACGMTPEAYASGRSN